MKKSIAIVGGGPSGLFLYKRLLESGKTDFTVDIFEAKTHLGLGMPYSHDGANREHVTNVSSNEIPQLVTSVGEWLQTVPQGTLDQFNLDRNYFSDYHVLPRLLFGQYLSAQFYLLLQQATELGIATHVHFSSNITDIIYMEDADKVVVEVAEKHQRIFDKVIICTGHTWPTTHEGKVAGYFDSPYPPAKIAKSMNHAVAIRGSSLTAIDAIRTLARCNGKFIKQSNHKLIFDANDDAPDFKMVMHSRHGLLPGIRFHLEDPHLSKDSLLSKKEIIDHRDGNDGFVSLDFIFEKNFIESFKDKDPSFYGYVKDMDLESFVETMMNLREQMDAFQLFKMEYDEAEQSIRRKKSIYWKEMLAILSFAMNYPAKYLSAEDMRRLQKVLMPLISVVIAFVPQSSCEEMIALHNAGRLEILSVGDDSRVETDAEGGITYHLTDDASIEHKTKYQTYIDCVGQRHLSIEAFPAKSLVQHGYISAARLRFKSNNFGLALHEAGEAEIMLGNKNDIYMKVPGIAITDNFRIIGKDGMANDRIFIMAVPYIGGFNPDYSGLDFCEEASKVIVDDIFKMDLVEVNC